MELAPNPKAVMVSGLWKRKYMATTPMSPTPTTVMPMTLPPMKAIVRASFMPCIAAKAVLPLDLVATFMPT